jgi:hypothetical protein
MMSRLKGDQGQLFYEFHLGDAVPEDDAIAPWHDRNRPKAAVSNNPAQEKPTFA